MAESGKIAADSIKTGQKYDDGASPCGQEAPSSTSV